MNERFIFRAKVLYARDGWDKGEWVYGAYLPRGEQGFISYFPEGSTLPVLVEVDPATVGQCTGLKGKNDKLIFKGDIIRVCPLWYDQYPDAHQNTPYLAEVKWELHPECKRGEPQVAGEALREWRCAPFYHCYGSFELVGNIHDNPELLEEVRDG